MSEPQDHLAALTFDPVAGAAPGAAPAGEQPQDENEAKMMQALEAGAVKIIFFGLKAVRANVSRKMPEILDEWSDPVLEGPAIAAVPVAKKYLAPLMQVAGSHPEFAMLAISLVPLAMGYVSAAERHSRTVTTVTEKPAPVDAGVADTDPAPVGQTFVESPAKGNDYDGQSFNG